MRIYQQTLNGMRVFMLQIGLEAVEKHRHHHHCYRHRQIQQQQQQP